MDDLARGVVGSGRLAFLFLLELKRIDGTRELVTQFSRRFPQRFGFERFLQERDSAIRCKHLPRFDLIKPIFQTESPSLLGKQLGQSVTEYPTNAGIAPLYPQPEEVPEGLLV